MRKNLLAINSLSNIGVSYHRGLIAKNNRKNLWSLTLFLIVCAFSSLTFAQSHHLTTSSIKPVGIPLKLTTPEAPAARALPPINDVIFNRKLSLEFKKQYFEQVGAVENKVAYPSYNHFERDSIQPGQNISSKEDYENRRLFGRYMFRRLAEHHVSDFVQTNRHTQPIHHFAQQISNASIRVNPKFDVKLNYNYSYNKIELELTNPLELKNTLSFVMDQSSVGPSTIKETIFSLTKELSKSLSISSKYTFNDRMASLITKKNHTENLASNITISTPTSQHGDSPREHLMMFGVIWFN